MKQITPYRNEIPSEGTKNSNGWWLRPIRVWYSVSAFSSHPGYHSGSRRRRRPRREEEDAHAHVPACRRIFTTQPLESGGTSVAVGISNRSVIAGVAVQISSNKLRCAVCHVGIWICSSPPPPEKTLVPGQATGHVLCEMFPGCVNGAAEVSS